jgi:hypothetical protein
MNEIEQTTAQTPEPASRGSLLLGVACAWGLLIGGYLVVALLFSATPHVNEGGIVLMLALPWLAMLGLIVWFAVNGKPRSAIGVAIGIASIIGVLLLLVAACFGLLAGGGWH